MRKKTYRYFISCNVKFHDVNGMTNHEVIRDSAIKGIADIIEIARLLEVENNYPINSIVVLFYREF